MTPTFALVHRSGGKWALVEQRSGHADRTVAVYPNETKGCEALNVAVFGRAA